MAELLVRIVDKNPGKRGASRAGDVIFIAPDGHQWGKDETTNPVWRIIQLPGVSPDSLKGLMEPQTTLGGGLANYRAIGFDASGAGVRLAIKAGTLKLGRSGAIALMESLVHRPQAASLTDA